MSDDARRLFIPVLILALAFFAMMAVQSFQLVRQHETLVARRATQESAVQELLKTRQQLNALAEKTARLADAGDANARAIVDQLRRDGITINPQK